MVSVYQNPPLGQDITQYYGCHTGGDLMKSNLVQNSSPWDVGSGVEDPSKKMRKPYTITKSRESWSEQEHDKFIEALHLFDRDWKKIEAFIGSKTVIQIRSHAQKYFQKVLKNGKSEHVPPPRPKRKAAHPYPQKAPKKDSSQTSGAFQSSAALLDSAHVELPGSVSMHTNLVDDVQLAPWTSMDYVPHIRRDDEGFSGGTKMPENNRDLNEVDLQFPLSNRSDCQVNEIKSTGIRGSPDFAQVYNFIGSVFDNCQDDHLNRLQKMDSINIWTALMLMKNLSINLVNPEFKDQMRFLSSSFYSSGKHSPIPTTNFE